MTPTPLPSPTGFITRMHARLLGSKAKLMLAVGGWTDSTGDKYSRMAATSASRAKFVDSALKFITDHGFAGLDLHWAFPGCPQGNCQEGSAMDKAKYAMLLRVRFWKGCLRTPAVVGVTRQNMY